VTIETMQRAPAPMNEAPPGEKELVSMVTEHAESFEDGLGRDAREKWLRFYRLYRGFKKWKNEWERSGPNDRDMILKDGQRTWGANLHIPYAFAIVETMVPRAIAQRPKMLYLPRDERWEENVENLRMLMDAQQERVDIELTFQEVLRSGMIYGLGASKTFWRKEYARRRKIRRRTFKPGEYVPGKLERVCTFDDPDYEDIDIFDLMWSEFGHNVKSCDWMLHRTWCSTRGVLDRIQSQAWATDSAGLLDEDKIRGLAGNEQKYDEVWQERMEAGGFQSAHNYKRGEHIHEVWEWHDGDRVLTVLDRQVLVQDAENPMVGQLPFQIYRPTPLQKQMIGIGELEPIEDLSRELDLLRSQRRDAATIALCTGYAFDEAAVELKDLVFGPASAIPVRNANPSNALMPLPKAEVPASSYQEEQGIVADIERVTGYQDSLGNDTTTATEAQLVQASLSKRVELKSRRFEVENIRPAARAWLALNQRMILKVRTERLPGAPEANDDPNVSRWKWFEVGPRELMGEFEVTPEGGTSAAENVAQKRQDALQLWQTFSGNPHVNQRWLLKSVLEKYDVKHPELAITEGEAPLSPQVMQVLQDAGVNPDLLEYATQVSQRADPQLPPPAVDVQQEQEAMSNG
jgi:hypothetical protein